MKVQCPRCQNIVHMINVHGHMQCSVCNSVTDDCCQGEVSQKFNPKEEFKLKPIAKAKVGGRPKTLAILIQEEEEK